MTLPLNVRKPGLWTTEEAPDRDVVLSSRVRFARNLASFPFPARATASTKERIVERCRDVLATVVDAPGEYLKIGELSLTEQTLLSERHLISREMRQETHSALYFSADERLGIMVNEEDHLRIQALGPGRSLSASFENAHDLERTLDNHLAFAFDDRWGYLTSCLTNLGTGLRASVLLHLPALVLQQRMNRVLKAISNLGLVVRGFYGEGSETRGFYFQLSNQVTLGQDAEQMKENLKRVTQRIIEQEQKARRQLLETRQVEIKDRIGRAYGVLRHAHKIGSEEALERLSLCRLGVALGLVRDGELASLDGLLIQMQPAHLQLSIGESMQKEERDYYRARLLRDWLKEAESSLNQEGTDGTGSWEEA